MLRMPFALLDFKHFEKLQPPLQVLIQFPRQPMRWQVAAQPQKFKITRVSEVFVKPLHTTRIYRVCSELQRFFTPFSAFQGDTRRFLFCLFFGQA